MGQACPHGFLIMSMMLTPPYSPHGHQMTRMSTATRHVTRLRASKLFSIVNLLSCVRLHVVPFIGLKFSCRQTSHLRGFATAGLATYLAVAGLAWTGLQVRSNGGSARGSSVLRLGTLGGATVLATTSSWLMCALQYIPAVPFLDPSDVAN